MNCESFNRSPATPLSHVRFRHRSFLTALGALCACIGMIQPVRASRPDIAWMAGGHRGVASVAVSPDGTILASAGDAQGDTADDPTVKIWRRSDGALLHTIEDFPINANALCFTPDGQHLAIAATSLGIGDPFVALYRVSDWSSVRTYDGHLSHVGCIAVSPDGTLLATGSDDQTAIIWNLATGAQLHVLTTHASSVRAIAFSPDGTKLATGSYAFNNNLKIWDVATGTELYDLVGHTFFVSGVAFSPDSQSLVSSGWDGTIRQWTVATGSLDRTFPTNVNGETPYGMALSSDGSTIAVGLGDSTIPLFDSASGMLVNTLVGHTGGVDTLTFAPGDAELVSGGFDSHIIRWRTSDGALLATVGHAKGPFRSVAFSPNSQLFAGSGFDQNIFVYQTSDGTELARLPDHALETFPTAVQDLEFSPDGMMLASSAAGDEGNSSPVQDHSIRLWTPAGALIRSLAGHDRGTPAIAFTSDSTRIASAGTDSLRINNRTRNRATIKIWDVSNGALLTTFPVGEENTRHTCIALSPNNQVLASGDNFGIITLWDFAGASVLRTIPFGGLPLSLAFSPDNTLIAGVGELNDVRVWRVADGALVNTFVGHFSFVQSVAFAPDGLKLYSGSGYDQTLRVWRMSDGAGLEIYDTETGRGTSPGLPIAISANGALLGYGRTDATAVVAHLSSVNPCMGRLRGDANCDTVVDINDVAPFAQALIDPDAYRIAHPLCNLLCAIDYNTDTHADAADIAPFIACVLGNTGCP